MTQRTCHILGVPLRTGSLYPGSENDAKAYRDAQLLARLQAEGCNAVDEGDLAVPDYLPHHSIPPVRNWPGPRIVWDCLSERIRPILDEAGRLPVLIGCDCSVVVGSTQALQRIAPDVHVFYLDGDFDDAPPDAARCQSAAALAVWLLTNPSPFWTGPPLAPSQVTVIGWTKPSQDGQRVNSIPLDEVRRSGPAAAARQALQAVPPAASILLHFDIDVLSDRDLPAAYFPHDEGLSMQEMDELLAVLLGDPRLRIVEISEYASLRDLDRRCIAKLVDLLCRALKG